MTDSVIFSLRIKYIVLRDKLKRKASLYRAKLMDLPYELTQKETRRGYHHPSYKKSYREMMDMNMEELCDVAINKGWDMQTLQAWSIFKIAQYLEKIAYEKGK